MSGIEIGLEKLKDISTKDQKTFMETIIKIYKNVVLHPTDAKYRILKLTNKRFVAEVWAHEAAQLMMLNSGWVLHEDHVELPMSVDLNEALNSLVEHRNVKPSETEWVEETKIVGQSVEKQREEELRKRALKQKAKEMAELKRDMEERKAIKERILAEHRNDKERRVTEPAIAVPRGDGGTAKMADRVKSGG